MADILPLLESNRVVIQKVADGTESLRGLYPQVNIARSFLGSRESSNQDARTLSLISERQFEFDDVAINSQAYRRVLVAATHTLKSKYNGDTGPSGDLRYTVSNELTSKDEEVISLQDVKESRARA